MKLLIVDDEELTRTGVITSLDWASLGIDEVLQADDGVHGLETARRCKPEIILCDVRMPRMDGISMLERLEKILPDTVPIFMSGYSDKEYLKAAIKLKAVNYIEKPFSISEIETAIREARELYTQKVHSRRGETLHSMETASRLALQLTLPYGSNSQIIEQLSSELGLTMNASTYFTSFIVKTDLFLDASIPSMTDFYQEFLDFLESFHMKCIYLEKKMQYLVYFLFSQNEPTSRQLQSVNTYLCSHFAEIGHYSMACGDTVYGLSKAYQTYTSAVILLQSSYFFPENTLLTSAQPDKVRMYRVIFFQIRRRRLLQMHYPGWIRHPLKIFFRNCILLFIKIIVFCRIRSKIFIINFFYVWKMHAINRRLQVLEILKALQKQLMTVSHFRNFIRR